MQLSKEIILKMLSELKLMKVAASSVEKELGFSNGLLGKGMLSDEKSDKFYEYFFNKTGKLLSTLVTESKREEIKPFDFDKLDKDIKEIFPLPKNVSRTKMVVEKTGLKIKPSNAVTEKTREAMAKINKDFGAGTIMFFGDKPNQNYEVVSTGSLQLDHALGIGGLPRGRFVEIFGMESCGKTTIALHVIANAQKQGLKCLLVDAENSFDPEYADALGVKIDDLEYCQPSCGEHGLDVADKRIASGEIGVVVIDSVAALIPKAELEGAMGDSKMGLHARLMSQACRKMTSSMGRTNTLVIFINQIRNKIGVMYGSPEVTTGGMALQFYASVRLDVKRSTTEKNSVMNGDRKEGNQTTVKVVKNKCAPPFRYAVFNIIYGKGIDRLSEMVDLAIEFKIIEKAGSWFTYNGTQIGQGKDSIFSMFETSPALVAEIEKKVIKEIGK